MHCTRRNSSPSAVARLRAASVLPSPGTSSNSTWPPPRMAASATLSGSRMPTTSVATSSSTALPRSATCATVSGVGCSVIGGGSIIVGRGGTPRSEAVEHVEGVLHVGDGGQRCLVRVRVRTARVPSRVSVSGSSTVSPYRASRLRATSRSRRSTRSPIGPSRPTIAHARSCTSPRAPCRRSTRSRAHPGRVPSRRVRSRTPAAIISPRSADVCTVSPAAHAATKPAPKPASGRQSHLMRPPGPSPEVVGDRGQALPGPRDVPRGEHVLGVPRRQVQLQEGARRDGVPRVASSTSTVNSVAVSARSRTSPLRSAEASSATHAAITASPGGTSSSSTCAARRTPSRSAGVAPSRTSPPSSMSGTAESISCGARRSRIARIRRTSRATPIPAAAPMTAMTSR